MSTELQAVTGRTQAEIEQSIIVKTQNLQRILVVGACDIGLDLTDLKAKCPHGEWGSTLKRLGYSSSTANNFMRLYQEYGTKQVSLFGGSNCQTFGNLEYSKALALLAVPSEEREQFAEEVKAEELSVRELKAKIKEMENQAEGWKRKAELAKADAETQKEAAQEQEKQNSLLSARVKELESRPVEVATVDATEEQLREAEQRGRDAAQKDADRELGRAKKKWKAEADGLKQLNEELSQALEAARLETDQYQGTNADLLAQVEQLKKNRVQADEPLLRMKLLFEQFQEAANAMEALLLQVDEVNREKLKKALPGALRQLAERLEG